MYIHSIKTKRIYKRLENIFISFDLLYSLIYLLLEEHSRIKSVSESRHSGRRARFFILTGVMKTISSELNKA